MTDQNSMRARWRDYQPSKTGFFWGCVASAAATIIIGFTLGGWVTAGSAQDQREDAVRNARLALAAEVCAGRFLAADEAAERLATFRQSTTWIQQETLHDGGYATLPGMKDPLTGTAAACAANLLNATFPSSAAEASSGEQPAG